MTQTSLCPTYVCLSELWWTSRDKICKPACRWTPTKYVTPPPELIARVWSKWLWKIFNLRASIFMLTQLKGIRFRHINPFKSWLVKILYKTGTCLVFSFFFPEAWCQCGVAASSFVGPCTTAIFPKCHVSLVCQIIRVIVRWKLKVLSSSAVMSVTSMEAQSENTVFKESGK